MERVKKDEPYYFITFPSLVIERGWDNYRLAANLDFESGNYFYTKEEAERIVNKLRAVLKGADVIELPSEEELQAAEDNYIGHPFQLDEGVTTSMCRTAFGAGIGWLLKSKIVK